MKLFYKDLSNIPLFLISTLVFVHAQGPPDTLWTRTYGGDSTDVGYSVQQTSDSGYIVVGSTRSFGAGGVDVYLVKTNVNGDTLWTRQYGGAGHDAGYSVQQTIDGGYIFVGSTDSFGAGGHDLFLIKTDSLGDTLWTKILGGGNDDWGYSIQQTFDGSFIIIGQTNSFGAGLSDVWLLKTDVYGDTLWTRTYGGVDYDGGRAVQQTSDSGYIFTGYTYSFASGFCDVWLVKTDSLGDTLWTRTYGGSRFEVGYSVQQTIDSGYIVAGGINLIGGGYNLIIKTDAYGDTLWVRTSGGAAYDYECSIQQTSDSGYIIVGTKTIADWGDIYIQKFSSNGDSLWSKTYGGSQWEWGSSVQQTADGGYIIVGATTSFGAGSWDVYLIKSAPEPGIEEEKVTVIKKNDLGATIISGPLLLPEGKNCKVFDITGQVVMPERVKPGIYFIEIDGRVTQKVVKVR